MNVKHCNACATTKPASEFHLRAASPDGLAARCKECQSTYDKARASDPARVNARKAYMMTERGREAAKRARRAYMERNPAKREAHIAVGNALRDGRLKRSPCEVCQNPRAEAHHDDYNKPLEVKWLCGTHHRQRHAELRGTKEPK